MCAIYAFDAEIGVHTLPTVLATANVTSSPAASAPEDPAAAAAAPPECSQTKCDKPVRFIHTGARTCGELDGVGTVLPLQLVRTGVGLRSVLIGKLPARFPDDHGSDNQEQARNGTADAARDGLTVTGALIRRACICRGLR